jgi:hypothetical protein
VADHYARLELREATVTAPSAYTPDLPGSACPVIVPLVAAAIP